MSEIYKPIDDFLISVFPIKIKKNEQLKFVALIEQMNAYY